MKELKIKLISFSEKTRHLNCIGQVLSGYNEWRTGKWQRAGNVLTLKYDGKKVEQLGEVILISKGYLNPIGKSFDKKKYP